MSGKQIAEEYKKAFSGCKFSLDRQKAAKAYRKNIEADRALEAIISAYQEWTNATIPYIPEHVDYSEVQKLVKHINYGKRDIELFCLHIEPGGDGDIGLYVSALINKIIKPKERIAIHAPLKLNYVGYRQSKGTVIVDGSTGYRTAMEMRGGKFIINGSAESFTAQGMLAGELTVKGSIADYSCWAMKGGIVRVKGKILELSDNIEGGKVYEAGRKIYPK